MLSVASRRGFLMALPAAMFAASAMAGAAPLPALERRHGGRLGVFAIDAASGRALGYRADERFLMCSTFKLLAVSAVLARVDAGQEQLDRRVSYSDADLLKYAPFTLAHVAEGGLPVEQLCKAAIEVSDNTAANLIVASLGGPQGVTGFARSLGDRVTRLDRTELALNTSSGEMDTTTPRAYATSVSKILLGDTLSLASRLRLEGWLAESSTGLRRVRAALPTGWRAGDKTGTGDANTNDVVILRPPERSPVIAGCYYESSAGTVASREAVLREAGTAIVAWIAAVRQ